MSLSDSTTVFHSSKSTSSNSNLRVPVILSSGQSIKTKKIIAEKNYIHIYVCNLYVSTYACTYDVCIYHDLIWVKENINLIIYEFRNSEFSNHSYYCRSYVFQK